MTGLLRREMHDHDEREPRVVGQRVKKVLQRLDGPGRPPNAHHERPITRSRPLRRRRADTIVRNDRTR